jgi:hypothetical protein
MSLVDYYRSNNFNPVPITVEREQVWREHCAKRRNLYERHLGIPLALLRDRAVIEFGPNSGENALVLAAAGAHLTLVEPNQQALPRLKALFERFGVGTQLASLHEGSMGDFSTDAKFDLAIAEGFLYTLSDRDVMLRRMAGLLSPGALGVVSFNCRYGGLIESVKRLLLWRACALAGEPVQDKGSLELARALFEEDYGKLNSSRPFSAWWKDTLVNPFYVSRFLWSFPEILPVIEAADGTFLSSSPQWSTAGHFTWYKATRSLPSQWHGEVIESWRRSFASILIGSGHRFVSEEPAPLEALTAVSDLVEACSQYTTSEEPNQHTPDFAYPPALEGFFRSSGEAALLSLNEDLQRVSETVTKADDAAAIVAAYRRATQLRSAWGTAYHYLSFVKG